MLYRKSPATDPGRSKSKYKKFVVITALLLAALGSVSMPADLPIVSRLVAQTAASTSQTYRKEIETGEKVSLSVKSRNGRVGVIASEEQKNVTIEASSTGAPVDAPDVKITGKGGTVEIEVRDRA